jgi:K+-sensing histidine kinase KdpD
MDNPDDSVVEKMARPRWSSALRGLAARRPLQRVSSIRAAEDRGGEGEIGRSVWTADAADYAASLLVVGAALFVGLLLQQFLAISNVALMLLLAIQLVAIIYGLGPALAACVVSTLGYNFLFIPPLYTLRIADSENAVTLFLFAVAALITSNLTSLVRYQAIEARDARIQAETEKLRSALLTSISHDLRTPLASILGSATSLKGYRATLDENAQRQLIDTIEEEAERLNRFISDLLDMTRLEAGAIELRTELVDLSDIVGSAIRRAGSILAGHKIITDLKPDLPMVKLDPVLYEQVLFNLFDNAAKYAPPQTTISLSAECSGPAIVIRIVDEGEGIPVADLERVFDRFYRVRAGDRQRAGTGLGLAICRGFVEAMGGTISAANRRDRSGAVFAVTIPVVAHAPKPADDQA